MLLLLHGFGAPPAPTSAGAPNGLYRPYHQLASRGLRVLWPVLWFYHHFRG